MRDMATGAARSVVKQELTRHAEREEARWQVGGRIGAAGWRAYEGAYKKAGHVLDSRASLVMH